METWEASTPGGERCAVSVYRSLVRVLAAFLLAGCVCPPLEAAQLKIAIVAFDAVNQPAKAGGWGRSVAEMLTTAAVNTGAFEVVERHMLEKVMSEQSMGSREVGFTSAAQSIGNMVGADYLLSGSVMKMEDQVRIDARLVDVASGAIITATSVVSDSRLDRLSKKIDELMASMVKSVYGAPPPPQEALEAQPAPAAGEPPVRMEALFATAGGVQIPLAQGDTLTAADAYYVQLDVGRRLYVYAVQIDAAGALYALFPNQAFCGRDNPLPPGRYRVPAGENFYLDQSVGKETLFVLASPGPLENVDRVFAQLETADPFAMEDLVAQFQEAFNAAASEYKSSVWFWHK